jgi:hypothetical protein
MVTLALAGCSTTRTVEVPIPVNVPGPVQYVPVPAALLECEDTGEPPKKGVPLGELFAWAQRTRAASVACIGKMGEIKGLATPPK